MKVTEHTMNVTKHIQQTLYNQYVTIGKYIIIGFRGSLSPISNTGVSVCMEKGQEGGDE